MPFDALTYSTPPRPAGDFIWTGTAAQMHAILSIRTAAEWERDVSRLSAAVKAKCAEIGRCNRRIAALRTMPKGTFMERLCFHVAARASHTDRGFAFASVNRLRVKLCNAQRKLVIARIAGEA